MSAGFDWWRLVPGYWTQVYPTCREWDALLNALLDAFEPAPGYHTCTLGGVTVWTSNWPYGYGGPYEHGSASNNGPLPLVRTRKRLRKALMSRNYTAARTAIAKATGGQP